MKAETLSATKTQSLRTTILISRTTSSATPVMKVYLNMKIESKDLVNSSANRGFDLIVGPSDTVSSIKERVASIEPTTGFDQVLAFDGRVLDNDKRVADCGVKDGDSLDFVVRASVEAFVQQLRELLQAKALSPSELGLMYCHRYGTRVAQALKILGKEENFETFLCGQKHIAVENGLVKVVNVNSSGTKPKKGALEKVFAEETLSLTTTTAVSEDEFARRLAELLQARAMTLQDLSLVYCYRHGMPTAQVLKAFGWGQHFPDFVKQRKEFIFASGCVRLASKVASKAPNGKDLMPAVCKQLSDLHAKICPSSFTDEVGLALDRVVADVQAATFFDVEQVLQSGSAGHGTAIVGSAEAELVLTLRGLPVDASTQWLKGLVQLAAGSFEANLDVKPIVEGYFVKWKTEGPLTIKVSFAPAYGSYRRAINLLSVQDENARPCYFGALEEQRIRFMDKQPAGVKATMRLLKWWRGQREWSSHRMRPSDLLLELLVVYSVFREQHHQQSRPSDQAAAIQAVLTLMAGFTALQVVWPERCRCYEEADVPQTLLKQRPLLMDPVNPFVNVADPSAFDPKEMMDFARSQNFL